GVEAFLGTEAQFGATVRVGGGALRMRVNALKPELRGSSKWSEVLLRYVQFLLVNVSQVAACNCFHSLERRFCSWLLTLQDRVKAVVIEITHVVYARSLGVRRVGITRA